MKEFKGLRLITNLHCNIRCSFCYQKDKREKTLSLSDAWREIHKYPRRYFEYCTIMGGETTVLSNVGAYVVAGAYASKQVRLTTNGTSLSERKLKLWKQCGLTGVNISIPVIDGKMYRDMTRSFNTIAGVLSNVDMCRRVFGSTQIRINIPLCRQNLIAKRLEEMLWLFLHIMDVKVTLCEDLHGTYSVLDNLARFGLEKTLDTGNGLVMLNFHGKELGYYCHKDNYKGTDLIVSPTGTFIGWDDYCKSVGMTV